MAHRLVTKEEIHKFIQDLPNSKKLSKEIADYVNKNQTYTLAQIGQVIDTFYNKSCGLSIAEDIKCLFN